MAAKWQRWIPLDIDAFRGSPAVQAMHPAARIGYLYLLLDAWQTEDCTIPNDPIELADRSGLGDDLWAANGVRILRKFTPAIDSATGAVMAGRLRNEVEFAKWLDAKRIFDSRKNAADRTNIARSPHEKGTVTAAAADTVTAREPSRSAYTGTGTKTGTKDINNTSFANGSRSQERSTSRHDLRKPRRGWIDPNIAVVESIRARYPEGGPDSVCDVLSSHPLDGHVEDARAALPAPVGAADSTMIPVDGHELLSATPAGSAAPAPHVTDERRTA